MKLLQAGSNRAGGLTLVEVIVSVGFIALAILPLFGIVNGSLGKSSDALGDVLAMAQAEMTAEYMRSMNPELIPRGQWIITRPQEKTASAESANILPDALKPLELLASEDESWTPMELSTSLRDDSMITLSISFPQIRGRDASASKGSAAGLFTLIMLRGGRQ